MSRYSALLEDETQAQGSPYAKLVGQYSGAAGPQGAPKESRQRVEERAPDLTYGQEIRAKTGHLVRGLAQGPAAIVGAIPILLGPAKDPAKYEAIRQQIANAGGLFQEDIDAQARALEGAPLGERVASRGVWQGLGSALSMLGGGVAAGGSRAAMAGSGAVVQATGAYYEAKAAGADDDAAAKAFALGLPLGATEAFGIGGALGAANKATGGALMRRLALEALKEGGEETVQEIVQTIGSNLVAQGLYDPERGLLEGVPEAALSAAVLGSGFGAGAGAMQPGQAQAAPTPEVGVGPDVAPTLAPQPAAPPAAATTEAPGGAPPVAGAGVPIGPGGTVIEPVAALEPQADAYLKGERGILFVDRPADDPDLAAWAAEKGLVVTPTEGGAYLSKPGKDLLKARRTATAEAKAASPEDRERIRAKALGYAQAKPDLDPATTVARETLDEQGRVIAQEAADAAAPPLAENQREVPVEQALAERLIPESIRAELESATEFDPEVTQEEIAAEVQRMVEAEAPVPPALAAAPPRSTRVQPAPAEAGPKSAGEPKAPEEVSAFPGGLLKLPGVREFASGLKRNLTSKGHLPPEAFEADIRRKASANAEIQSIHEALRDFHRATKADLGKKPNDLPPAMLARIDQALKGGTALTLPPRIREATTRMRDSIDRMSRRLIQSGAIEAKLIPHVRKNLGFYATRSFRVFEDPKWAEEVDPAIRNKAKAFIRQEFAERARKGRRVFAMRARLARARAAEARVMKEGARKPEKHEARAAKHEAHARKMVEQGKGIVRELADPLAEGKIAAMLFEGKAAQGPIALIRKSKLGSKDLSILTRRKQIAPEIRALYGEYKDPRINYAKSVLRMANLIANHQFLEEVREAGLGTWLREAPTVENGVEYKAKIAADESSVMAPLNGLYTTPEIDQAFRDATSFDPLDKWLRVMLGINAVAKTSKTVGNPISAQRNLIGNVGFAIAQGHWRAWKMAGSLKSVATKWGITDAITDPDALLGSASVAKWRAYYRRALELGVIHEDTRSGEIRDAIKDAAGMDTSAWLEKRTARAIKMPVRAAIEYYRVGDDIWKLYAWENEKARYRKAKPEWSEEQVEAHTAQIVRNTYPTYSLVPRGVKLVRRFPLTGPFMSFPAEVYRNAKNTAQLIKTELGDPELRGIGAQRLVGSLTAASMTAGLALALRAIYGITADDDEDAREFVPPWSKNSDLFWLRWGEEGKASYIDASYSDPWNYLKEPVMAVLRGDDPEEAAWDAFKAAAEPLLSEEIAAGAFIDILRNKTKRGGEVYSEAESPTDRARAIVGHVWEAVEPGFVDTMQRLEMGLRGEVSEHGQEFDPTREALAVFSGVRLVDFEPVEQLKFLARAYNRKRAQGSSLGSRVLTRQGNVSDDEIRDAVESADMARRGAYEDMRAAVRAALDLGVPRGKVFASLRSAGTSEEEAQRLLFADEPEPWTLSTSTRKDMVNTLGMEEAVRRIKVYTDARPATTGPNRQDR